MLKEICPALLKTNSIGAVTHLSPNVVALIKLAIHLQTFFMSFSMINPLPEDDCYAIFRGIILSKKAFCYRNLLILIKHT